MSKENMIPPTSLGLRAGKPSPAMARGSQRFPAAPRTGSEARSSRLPAGWEHLLLLASLFSMLMPAAAATRVLDAKMHHLGTAGQPEWKEFQGKTPEGRELSLAFHAPDHTGPATLFLTQENVKYRWPVELNGRRIGTLEPMETHQVNVFEIPSGSLQRSNHLAVLPPEQLDDIFVGDIRLDLRPVEEALNEVHVTVEVADAGTARPLPCRLTLVNERGALMPLLPKDDAPLAVRAGVIYTANGKTRFSMPAGKYRLCASRGFEYNRVEWDLQLSPGKTLELSLWLEPAVPTEGWAACDTHIHTFTISRHGDATLEERMITLAGEGIELPVATDHNHHTDYQETARKMGVAEYFTPIIGNEVTTKTGHFNVFPVEPNSAPPDHRLADWSELMASIRSTPGVEVVILNHPRDLHSGFRPLGPENFDPVTGEARGMPFLFDGMEVINSAALQADPMQLYRDWFALLNHGKKIVAVGASDSHDVSRFIVGQGRTYVRCDDTNPGNIDIDEVVRSFEEGRLLVSLGLWVNLEVDGNFGVGDLATPKGKTLQIKTAVKAPEWVSLNRIELYQNGRRILREKAEFPEGDLPNWLDHVHTMPNPGYDFHLVAMAWGPRVTDPSWEIPRPYQHPTPSWQGNAIGSTNPVWVDGDGDGVYTSPLGYAEGLIQEHEGSPTALMEALRRYDYAVAVQTAGLCRKRGLDPSEETFKKALKEEPAWMRQAFEAVFP